MGDEIAVRHKWNTNANSEQMNNALECVVWKLIRIKQQRASDAIVLPAVVNVSFPIRHVVVGCRRQTLPNVDETKKITFLIE